MKVEMPFFVYFAECQGQIKIGKSRHPFKRMFGLKNLKKNSVRLLALTTKYSEEELHKKFEKYRIEGEWFYFTEEISAFIDSLKEDTENCKLLFKEIREQQKLERNKDIKHFISKTVLSSDEIKYLVDFGIFLFVELKRIALDVRDPEVTDVLQKYSRLAEILNKWEEDLDPAKWWR